MQQAYFGDLGVFKPSHLLLAQGGAVQAGSKLCLLFLAPGWQWQKWNGIAGKRLGVMKRISWGGLEGRSASSFPRAGRWHGCTGSSCSGEVAVNSTLQGELPLSHELATNDPHLKGKSESRT